MKSVLFVCHGNICRSPAAEGIFKSIVAQNGKVDEYHADSAGVYGGHEYESPDMRMRHCAAARGYKLDHLSRPFMSEDFDMFDYIIVMDAANYDGIKMKADYPESMERVSYMTDYCTRFDIDHVPDPYYLGYDGFEHVVDILEDACAGLFRKLEENT